MAFSALRSGGLAGVRVRAARSGGGWRAVCVFRSAVAAGRFAGRFAGRSAAGFLSVRRAVWRGAAFWSVSVPVLLPPSPSAFFGWFSVGRLRLVVA